MKRTRIASETAHLKSDIVARDEATIAIGRRIFDRLRGDWRTQLLKARHRCVLQGYKLRITDNLAKPSVKFVQYEMIGGTRRSERKTFRSGSCPSRRRSTSAVAT